MAPFDPASLYRREVGPTVEYKNGWTPSFPASDVPASVHTAHAPLEVNGKCDLLDKLPLEIRRMIYAYFVQDVVSARMFWKSRKVKRSGWTKKKSSFLLIGRFDATYESMTRNVMLLAWLVDWSYPPTYCLTGCEAVNALQALLLVSSKVSSEVKHMLYMHLTFRMEVAKLRKLGPVVDSNQLAFGLRRPSLCLPALYPSTLGPLLPINYTLIKHLVLEIDASRAATFNPSILRQALQKLEMGKHLESLKLEIACRCRTVAEDYFAVTDTLESLRFECWTKMTALCYGIRPESRIE